MLKSQGRKDIIDPGYLAQYYKYFKQFQISSIVNKIPLPRIAAKGFYSEHADAFNRLAKIAAEDGIDPVAYIKFFVFKFTKPGKSIDDDLTSSLAIVKFKEYIESRMKLEKIYKQYMRTASTIVDDCLKLDLYSCRDYIKYIISEKKIAAYYMAGKISTYYFAAIPNFKKIIPKLDHFAREELSRVYDRFDIYNSEVNSACLMFKNQKANPIKMTDDLLFKKRCELSASQV